MTLPAKQHVSGSPERPTASMSLDVTTMRGQSANDGFIVDKSSEGGSLAREHRLPMAGNYIRAHCMPNQMLNRRSDVFSGSSNVTGSRLPESRLKPKVVHDSWGGYSQCFDPVGTTLNTNDSSSVRVQYRDADHCISLVVQALGW